MRDNILVKALLSTRLFSHEGTSWTSTACIFINSVVRRMRCCSVTGGCRRGGSGDYAIQRSGCRCILYLGLCLALRPISLPPSAQLSLLPANKCLFSELALQTHTPHTFRDDSWQQQEEEHQGPCPVYHCAARRCSDAPPGAPAPRVRCVETKKIEGKGAPRCDFISMCGTLQKPCVVSDLITAEF